MIPRVIATEAALVLIQQLKDKHGPLMFLQSAGCCDGSAPMCFKEDDFYIGSRDRLLGMLGDVPYYMHETHYSYYKHMQLILDVMAGRGASFSLESSEDKAFILRSRIFTEAEQEQLNNEAGNR